jgi:hypothetical protein
MSTNREHNRKILLEKLHELDSVIRGTYFTNVSSLDALIRDIISYHFCAPGQDERRRQFISLVLEEHLQKPHIITSILEKIISGDYSDQLKKYPNLFEDLHRINEYTLWLYKAILDTSQSFLSNIEFNDAIRLTYYDQKGIICYSDVTREQIEERLADCFNVHFALEDIRSEIRDRVLTNSR